ncbi:MAG TPA: DUF2332 domain-containing protein [Gaiellaceae bacterium]
MSESTDEVFRRMADDFEQGGSKLYASLARSLADDPLVAGIVGKEVRWEAPLRLFGGVHYLELSGMVQHPWGKLRGVLEANRDWLARFVAAQPIQTNEVQRCWGLLPAFLAVVDGRPLDLVELGPSGGLNLYWDRYFYRYGEESWGDPGAGLRLVGIAEGGPPAELFDNVVEVGQRIGIDRRPVDVTTAHGARLLEAFVWADQTDRLERVRRAIEIARQDPPRLLEGDYVEVLPALLAERDLGRLTVVYHSVSTVYLRSEDRERLDAILDEDGNRGSLARISYEVDRDTPTFHGFALDLDLWPGGRRRLARLDGHANSLEWVS